MANVLVSDLTALGATPAGADLLELETSGGASRKVTVAEVAAYSGFTAASASGPAQVALAEDTDNGAHTVTIKAPASVTASVVTTLANATHDLGAVYLERTLYLPTAASLGTTDNSVGRGASLKLPCDMTITSVKFAGNAQTGNDTNYWTYDVRYIDTAGLNTAGTSLMSATQTSQSTGGIAPFSGGGSSLDNQEISLTVNQNLTRSKGDLIYLFFTPTASPANYHSNALSIIVEGTRR